MVAGLYLGELLRLVLIDLHAQHIILHNQDLSAISEPYSIDTSVLSDVEVYDAQSAREC